MRPVFLVGFMCSGKSVVGRALAARMALRHVDIDRMIEQRIGPITPWFNTNGEEAFRKLERTVLAELLNERSVVISTGGGTPVAGDNLDHMLAAGTVVFLDIPLADLQLRVAQKGRDRPLLLGLQGEALDARVAELLAERLPAYSRAHMRVRATDPPEVIAERIEQALQHAPERPVS